MKRPSLALSLALLSAAPALAQRPVAFSVGPQVSTLGVGVGASARFTRMLGVAAEYSLVPLSDVERSGFGNEVLIRPALRGGLLLATFHPGGGKFTVGGGLQLGGANADLTLALATGSGATVDIGDHTYAADDIGTLNGAFRYGVAVKPTVMLGWSGKGLNLALGAALATPTFDLSATGPLKNDAAFQADLKKEIADFDDAAGQVPVYPYLRLGWQFKL